jgi:plastocyanin
MQLLQQIWNGILDFTKLLVIPDWGALIALLPVFMGVLVLLFFVYVLARYRAIGARRRRPGRIQPPTPPGVHMPGPTYAPILAAAASFLLFAGLVFNGVILVVGLIGLVLSLLYWGREGIADYDHVAGDHPALPAVTHPGPPPGVHMPGPSFRPILAALGTFVLFAGLVFGGWVLAVGVIFTIVSLLGWLGDARKEYHHVVRADTIGHLENDPPPGWPKVVVPVFGFLVVVAIALNAGWFPPRSAAGGGAGASAVPSGGPAGSGGPGGSGAPGGILITAQNIKFNVSKLSAPADKPFTVVFDNKDSGTSHDFDIEDGTGAKVFDGKDFPGPAVKNYDVPALKAGTYKFLCSIHPALMNGELTVGG